ncbi:hypothetical protein ACE1SV_34190 [Streptomyces sp. E-15]
MTRAGPRSSCTPTDTATATSGREHRAAARLLPRDRACRRAASDRAKQAVRSETDRPHALRQAILSCRSGGVVSVIGVYGGLIDKFPAGAWMNRSLTLRSCRTPQCRINRVRLTTATPAGDRSRGLVAVHTETPPLSTPPSAAPRLSPSRSSGPPSVHLTARGEPS